MLPINRAERRNDSKVHSSIIRPFSNFPLINILHIKIYKTIISNTKYNFSPPFNYTNNVIIMICNQFFFIK